MIRQPTQVRDRILKLVSDMLFALRTHVTMLPELEADILNALEPLERQALTIALSDMLLVMFGSTHAPKEPRFSKSRRAMASKGRKGLRGAKSPYLTPEERRSQELLGEPK